MLEGYTVEQVFLIFCLAVMTCAAVIIGIRVLVSRDR